MPLLAWDQRPDQIGPLGRDELLPPSLAGASAQTTRRSVQASPRHGCFTWREDLSEASGPRCK
jgi:hypothetical protein